MASNLQYRHVLEHQVAECEYEIDGKRVLCRILKKGYALAGSDGMSGVFVSEEVPNVPHDFRFPLAVHEYEESYTFWHLNPNKKCPNDKDEAHVFAIQREIEAAESIGRTFLRGYLEFMLDLYDKCLVEAELRGSPTGREKGFREIYACKMREMAA